MELEFWLILGLYLVLTEPCEDFCNRVLRYKEVKRAGVFTLTLGSLLLGFLSGFVLFHLLHALYHKWKSPLKIKIPNLAVFLLNQQSNTSNHLQWP